METEERALYSRLMSIPKTFLGVFAVALIVFCAAGPAAAQTATTSSATTFTVSLLGGMGGSVDENDSGYDNSSVQLGFSVVTQRSVRVGVRAGRLGAFDRLADTAEADLEYVTIAGEYLFGEPGFVSGFFAGLGVYRLDGTRVIGGTLLNPVFGDPITTTTVGVTGGFTGEFDITPQLVFAVEIALHGTTQGDAQVFAHGLVGIGYKF